MAANPGPGWLCHVCAKASGKDPFKKPAAPRKRKAPGDKREVVHFVENRLPTLVNLCIKVCIFLSTLVNKRNMKFQVVTQHIDDVESLGDLGALNVEAIAKAMARNRSLYVWSFSHSSYTVERILPERLKMPNYSTTPLTPSLSSTTPLVRPSLCIRF